jgi:serine/threonine protein kinase/pimeloyl-ACP methyl ester carboxylesterase
MDPERWEEVRRIFDEVQDAAPTSRAVLLSARCGEDAELCREVESLLAASDAASSFFGSLADRAIPVDDSGDTVPGWLASGALAGSFIVKEKLGAGGMGHVYRATDTKLHRDVALKVLAEHLVGDPVQVARFRREARMLAALNHPSIAAIYGLEEVNGGTVLVLELVEGPTLADRLNGGRLPLGEAIHVAGQISDALAAAHHAGIVHRDLKPANVKLTPDGRVKVLDFGIAKSIGGRAYDEVAEGLTATRADGGPILGTLPYMSPEQLQGAATDMRTDVWAFGVVLFEMVAGRRPFSGTSPALTLARILEREPPWEALPLDTPPALVGLLRSCLAREAHDRLSDISGASRVLSRVAVPGGPRDVSGGDPEASGEPPSTASLRRLEQEIRFCTASDGVRIAYATVGSGPVILKAANWLNHLEYDWGSPVWRHVFRELARDHTLVRYDERGNGLSDRDVEDLSFDAFVRDLETVADAAGHERFALFGISQGAPVSIAYAVAHPDRVSHLILLGGYPLGRGKRSADDAEQAEAMRTLMRLGWGKDNDQFRQLFTSSMIPGATREQMRWFNDLQRMTASAETAVRLRRAFDTIDVTDLLRRVRVPTLVLHTTGDAAVPFEQGRMLASGIPGARFCALDSQNHLLLEDEPAWPRFLFEVRRFLAP